MNPATQSIRLQGEAGAVEALMDLPPGEDVQGTVVIAHPHPLFGGSMHNKVVQTLARAFVSAAGALYVSNSGGWVPVRVLTMRGAVRPATCCG
ncbi:MAG: hypothetical protein RLZZ280_1242 [Pseudomonadota bacterium]